VGRPKLQKKKTVAGERVDRKWCEAAESGRKQSGEVTLDALFDALDRDKPGLVELQRRLAGILVKFGEAENKKPKYKRQKNPVLVMDPFYMLAPKLLDACLSVFPVSNTPDSAISIDQEASQGSQPDAIMETVAIKDVDSRH
jgi:hypothetical protein